MPSFEIKEVFGEDKIRLAHPISRYAFNDSPPLVSLEKELAAKKDFLDVLRVFIVFEAGKGVACMFHLHMHQNIRGKIFPMSGIATVASLPEARRKGYIRHLFHHLYQELYQSGFPCSTLYPFRPSFYERMGYSPLHLIKNIVLDIYDLTHYLSLELEGNVERHIFKEGYQQYAAYLRRHSQLFHGSGQSDNLYPETNSISRGDYWLAFAKIDGKNEGVIMYNIDREEMEMNVIIMRYNHPQAEYLLLNYIARHIDQVHKVAITLPEYAFPEHWMRDKPPLKVSYDQGPMGRITHLPLLSGMEVGEGEVSIALKDDMCPWQAGNYILKANNGHLEIEKSQQTGEITLSIQGLNAMVYGVLDPAYLAYKGWGNISETAGKKLRNLFPPRKPFLHARF